MAPVNALSHVSLGTNDFPSARRFYDAVLATLEIRCVIEFDEGAGYGREFPEFWVQLPFDGAAANPGNGVHVCFNALSKAQVDAFHRKAIEMGAEDEGKPGFRTEYTENYYGAFVRDLDGHKIEAMCLVQKG